jgi:hypothetical protein
MNIVGIHPSDTNAAQDSYTEWTGSAGIIVDTGPLSGGPVADPAAPGSGSPGSVTTEPSRTDGVNVDSQNQTQKLLTWGALIALAVILLKK